MSSSQIGPAFQNAVRATFRRGILPRSAEGSAGDTLLRLKLAFHHVELSVADPGRSARFYVLYLGAKNLPRSILRLRRSRVEVGRDGEDVVFQDPDGHWVRLVDLG
jgi:hypothetical protein